MQTSALGEKIEQWLTLVLYAILHRSPPHASLGWVAGPARKLMYTFLHRLHPSSPACHWLCPWGSSRVHPRPYRTLYPDRPATWLMLFNTENYCDSTELTFIIDSADYLYWILIFAIIPHLNLAHAVWGSLSVESDPPRTVLCCLVSSVPDNTRPTPWRHQTWLHETTLHCPFSSH